MAVLWFKVLVDGKSCHSGSLRWSLPTFDGETWRPGDWHEVIGALDMCSNGLHITSRPAKWYADKCVIFVAEYDGEIVENGTDKIACRRVRLLREATDDELEKVFVFYSDVDGVEIPDGETAVSARASNATLVSHGSSTATLVSHGSSTATLVSHGSLTATLVSHGSSTATLVSHGSSTATLVSHGSSTATLESYDSSNARLESY